MAKFVSVEGKSTVVSGLRSGVCAAIWAYTKRQDLARIESRSGSVIWDSEHGFNSEGCLAEGLWDAEETETMVEVYGEEDKDGWLVQEILGNPAYK